MTRTAIVIGGGIAGSLAAIALQKAGVSATLYEAYPEGAGFRAGSWLTVAVNGLSAMRKLGVHEAVKAVAFPTERIDFTSGSGKSLGSLPIGGRLADGTVTHTVKRADLYRVLCHEVSDAGVQTLYDKRLVDASQSADGVVARFQDGSEARADFLIGADGVRSATRGLIAPGAAGPRYTGLQDVGGFAAPPERAVAEPGAYGMVFGKRCFFGYVTAPDGAVWWFANAPSARELTREELAEADWRSKLEDLFADDRGPMLDLIARTSAPLVGTNQYDMNTVKTWQRGRMLIIGDAAHAAAPSSGQGASMAAEDAVALSACLQQHADVEVALARFVELRRERVERVVAYGRRYASAKAAGPVGRVIRDFMLPFVFRMQSRHAGPETMTWLFDPPGEIAV